MYLVVGLLVHEFCTLTDGYRLLCVRVKCDYRWLVDGNLTIGNDDGIGGTEVHGQLTLHREETFEGKEVREHSHFLLLDWKRIKFFYDGCPAVCCIVTCRTSCEWPYRNGCLRRKPGWRTTYAVRVS